MCVGQHSFQKEFGLHLVGQICWTHGIGATIHPSIHWWAAAAAGPFLPPLIRYVDPADFLSRDHCLLSINKRPPSLSLTTGSRAGSFLGQVTTNTAQKEKEDEKRTVRTDGWMGDVHQWKRARERERGRCTNRSRKWRGTRSTTPKTQPTAALPFSMLGEERVEDGKKGGDLAPRDPQT